MITTTEALNIVKKSWPRYTPQSTDLTNADYHILAEDIYTDRDYPPANKSIMDGIAINFQKYAEGTHQFKIAFTQAAGQPQKALSDLHHCAEIMTGALVPDNCDCIIPVEHIKIENDIAILNNDISLTKFQFIKKRGEDASTNQMILAKGTTLTPPCIALCAAVGHNLILTDPILKVAIISTGDEIVSPDQKVEPHQIHSSNDYFIKSLLEKTNRAYCDCFHVCDDETLLKTNITAWLSDYDILVFSGGVSMGKFDLVPKVLNDLNIKQMFHKVRQKPGKPLWYGMSEKQQPVFGLPGNPVSSYTCSVRFIRDILLTTQVPLLAKSKHRFECPGKITKYVMVKCTIIDNETFFEKINFKGSGDLFSITQSDGFIEIPETMEAVETQQTFQVHLW